MIHSHKHLTKSRANRRGEHLAVNESVAGNAHLDVAALAQLYNAPNQNHIERAEMLEKARIALSKYDLTETDVERAADVLARVMYMLIEQNGGAELGPDHQHTLECHVLDWCGHHKGR